MRRSAKASSFSSIPCLRRRHSSAGRELRVALTCPWHAPSAPELGVPAIVIDARPGFYPDEHVLWLAEHGALVFGDSFPGGPIPDDWLPERQTRADYRSWLSPLLALPVELVLPTHGDPGGRDLLERALPARAEASACERSKPPSGSGEAASLERRSNPALCSGAS
jgi:hypothetical protein